MHAYEVAPSSHGDLHQMSQRSHTQAYTRVYIYMNACMHMKLHHHHTVICIRCLSLHASRFLDRHIHVCTYTYMHAYIHHQISPNHPKNNTYIHTYIHTARASTCTRSVTRLIYASSIIRATHARGGSRFTANHSSLARSRDTRQLTRNGQKYKLAGWRASIRRGKKRWSRQKGIFKF